MEVVKCSVEESDAPFTSMHVTRDAKGTGGVKCGRFLPCWTRAIVTRGEEHNH